MNNTATESKWDRSKRLELVFPVWCQKIAAALGGTVDAPRDSEHTGRWNTVRLPDGLTFDLHLNGYESRVAVSGNWPKDSNAKSVTPREAIRYDTEAAKIHVGAERDAAAAAKDIVRRFLPAYREQYAACLARVGERNAYQNKVTANTRRLADTQGLASTDKHSVHIADGRGEIYPALSGLWRGVSVSGDSARFELDLPIEQAEQILRTVVAWARNNTEPA